MIACVPAGVDGTVSAANVANNMLRTVSTIRFGVESVTNTSPIACPPARVGLRITQGQIRPWWLVEACRNRNGTAKDTAAERGEATRRLWRPSWAGEPTLLFLKR